MHNSHYLFRVEIIQVVLLLVISTSCNSPEIDPLDLPIEQLHLEKTPTSVTVEEDVPEEISISFGSSAGMCYGYCKREYRLRPRSLHARRQSWEREKDEYPEQHEEIRIDAQTYELVLAAIDTAIIWKMPGIIGCPDCADGGSCWLDITVDGKQKQITYDCVTYIGELDTLVSRLYKVARRIHWQQPGTYPMVGMPFPK